MKAAALGCVPRAMGLVLACAGLWAFSPRAWCEELFTVRKTAYAQGVGLAARQKAIEAAQREVVGDILAVLAPGQDPAPLRPMLNHAEGYVYRYDVIGHEHVGDTTRVEVDVHVREGPLHQDLAAIMLPRLSRKPKTLLVVGEQIAGDTVPAVLEDSTVERALIEGLGSLGLDMEGVAALAERYTQAQLIGIVTGGVEAGQRLARENLRDVVIVGTAIVDTERDPEGRRIERNRARLSLRVYRGLDGKMVDEVATAAAVHSTYIRQAAEQAICDASRKALRGTVVPAVLAVLSAQSPELVLLTVHRPGNRDRMRELIETIEAIPEVRGTEELGYADALARVLIRYEGYMADLVELLAHFTYGGKKFHIEHVLERDMVVRFPE